jgi:PAS domain S-box-containing protein
MASRVGSIDPSGSTGQAMPATVLVVDDYPAGLYAKCTALERAGFRVLKANTGGEAIRIVSEQRPVLVVLDVKLPDIDGFAVCRAIKGDSATANTTVLQVSAYYTSIGDCVEGLDGGADAYIPGDIAPGLLVSAVRSLLRGSQAEHALRVNEEHMRLAQTLAGVGTWEWNMSQDSWRLSESMAALLGLGGHEMPDSVRGLLEYVYEEDRSVVDAALRQALAAGGQFDVRFRTVWPDGSVRWLLARGRLANHVSSEPERLLGAAIDITDQQRIEEEAERERQRLNEEIAATGIVLDRTKEELRNLAANLLAKQEEERRRIARELHDELAQQVAVLEMSLRHIRHEPASIDTQLDSAIDRVAGLARDVRNISQRLHPSSLEHLGLNSALCNLCEEWERTYNMAVQYTSRARAHYVPTEVVTCVYRIAQEALRNVHKHAGDARVVMILSETDQDLTLTVRDDGRGFDPVDARKSTGLGFLSMQERVRLIGGRLVCRSAPQKGTEVEISVPVGRAAIAVCEVPINTA